LAAVDLSVRVLAKTCSTCPASTSVWAAIVALFEWHRLPAGAATHSLQFDPSWWAQSVDRLLLVANLLRLTSSRLLLAHLG
jgi:hypothetical protein